MEPPLIRRVVFQKSLLLPGMHKDRMMVTTGDSQWGQAGKWSSQYLRKEKGEQEKSAGHSVKEGQFSRCQQWMEYEATKRCEALAGVFAKEEHVLPPHLPPGKLLPP